MCLLLSLWEAFAAQPEQIIDQVAAVIGNKILLKSEVETQYQQMISQGIDDDDELKMSNT